MCLRIANKKNPNKKQRKQQLVNMSAKIKNGKGDETIELSINTSVISHDTTPFLLAMYHRWNCWGGDSACTLNLKKN